MQLHSATTIAKNRRGWKLSSQEVKQASLLLLESLHLSSDDEAFTVAPKYVGPMFTCEGRFFGQRLISSTRHSVIKGNLFLRQKKHRL